MFIKILCKMDRIIGGFMCAMSDCHENSGASRHLSFFRFPSDPERAKLWLQACGIKKDILPKKLYNNYRVCSKHFAPHMFLNDLKNRLQPHAIPNAVFNITNEEETSAEKETGSLTQEDVFSVVATCSTLLNVNISNDDNQTSENDKATQTESKLSNSTPRKVALRRKCDAAEKRAKRAKLKYNEEKIEDITFSDFQKLLYKFYPKPIADFMKAQGENLNKKKNEVTDMGTDYQKAAKKLGVTEETPYYIVNKQKIFYFFDPPHLIKAARNNLLTNVIKSGDKILPWQYIEQLFEIDKENINR